MSQTYNVLQRSYSAALLYPVCTSKPPKNSCLGRTMRESDLDTFSDNFRCENKGIMILLKILTESKENSLQKVAKGPVTDPGM